MQESLGATINKGMMHYLVDPPTTAHLPRSAEFYPTKTDFANFQAPETGSLPAFHKSVWPHSCAGVAYVLTRHHDCEPLKLLASGN